MWTKQRNYAPAQRSAGALHRGEYIRADRPIGIMNSHGNLEDRLKGLPDVKMLGLAANKDRYRLQVAGCFAGGFCRNDTRRLCRASCFARGCHGIELRLQLRLRRSQL